MQEYYVEVYGADGPNPATEWFSNPECTLLHRVGAPACEYADGDYSWWLNGKRHRVDGPSLNIWGNEEWWLEGVKLTKAEHARLTAPAQEMTVAQIEAALGKRVKIVK